MNPKWEEGEFYMKKSLLVLASIMILALCTFVACTSEVSDPYDGLTYVTFGGESPTSKNLLASYEVASYDSLYWFYTAEKKDNYGTSGAVKDKPVHEGNTGLNNPVGPFSQGKWLFTLSAYKKNAVSEDAKVYEGSVEVSLKGQKVTVPVSVTPYGETGALEFNDVYFSWKDNAASSTAIPFITIVAEGTTTGQKYTLSNSFTALEGVGSNDVKIPFVVKDKDLDGKFYIDYKDAKSPSVVADYYTSTIIAYIDDPNTPIFSQTLGFRVYGSATTVISGNITEQSGTKVNFDPAKQDMAVFKGVTTASVGVTPSGTNTTTVDFGADNLDNTSTYYLNVSATSAASAANKFTVSDPAKAPVAGIDLELVEVSSVGKYSKVKDFTGGVVTVATYIEKGLTGVTVEYNGTDGDDPVGVDYNSDTGKLTFTTNHFSEFYAVSDSVAVVSNGTTEKGYARLVDAFDNSVDGCSIKLLTNIKMSSMVRITRSICVDLKGFAITTSSDFPEGAGIFTVREGGFLTIDDSSTGKTGLIENSKKDGDANSVERYGIVVFPYKSSNEKALNDSGYAKLIVNGGTIKASYAAISGNGSFGSDTNTEIVVKGGVLEGGVTAVYHPQNGNIIVNGGSFKGNDSAIEIRAGKMTIDGGTFTANATEYSCTANDDGATTVGASIAVAQHNTKLPIDVTISGGTFSGYHALSVVNPQNNDYAAISKINVNVKDGKFTSTKAKEGVEAVNYSSEFKKIDDVSSFTIRARKDGDEGNVTSLPDGRFFSSLQGAVDGVKDGSTVSLTLLNDVYEGGSLIVEDGRNLRLTLDFNDKTYYAFKVNESSGPTSKVAFKFGKDNTVVLKKGTLTTKQKFNVTLVENYSNLTVNDFTIIGWKNGSLFASSALTCHYGDTLITGTSMIIGGSNSSYKAIDVSNDFSDSYSKGVTVEFDEYFKGSVTGYVDFALDTKNKCAGAQYKHSLIIKGNADCFKAAQFCFSRVGVKSFFQMNGKTNIYTYSKFPTCKDKNGATVLDKDVAIVHNKTIDAIYEELSRAMTDTSDKFENELELMKKECVLEYSISQPNGKTIILDLNGCKIKADTNIKLKSSNGMFAVGSEGKLIIRDNSADKGSIDSSNNSNVPCCIFVDSRGGLEIESGITIKAAQGMKAATGCSSEIITEGYTYPSN